MGTSTSGSGPGDKTPLLPSWALPSSDEEGGIANPVDSPEAVDDTIPGGETGSGHPDGGENDQGPEADEVGQESSGGPPPQSMPTGVSNNWNSAKRRLGSVVTNRSGRRGIAQAGQAYVRALGGSIKASGSATSARSATSRLGCFLSNVVNGGMRAGLESLGLVRFVGRDSNTVFAAIINALAPEGATLEEAASRKAIQETLAGLFEDFVAPDGTMVALEAMSVEDVRLALQASVAASIFNRWLGDLAKQLEEKAVTASEAVRLERDMQTYIRDTVMLDLNGKDPLKMDWVGEEGTLFVDRIYAEAYSILGGQR